ncbi:MAG: SCO family protein, partial [Deltaproteobacteria bacterium]|nr:SCO family protein [Deltaproteobacteria bacterium]
SDYFNDGKPLVVSFIYTSCPVVCPAITAEFKKAVDEARSKFGDRFSVLSIGFDAENDTPEKLREYGSRFTDDFKRFRFAGGDRETIERMARSFGFFYRKKADGSFDHIDMVTTLRADGTIYRQVYSLRTQAEKLTARLDEMIAGKPALEPGASLMDRLKYFCYKYDPYTGKYAIDYSVFAGVGIQLTVILTIIYAVWGGRIKGFFRKKG